MKNDLPNNITTNELEKVQENLKAARGRGKGKTNCFCRERQARNRKVCGNLWSYSGYQKIPTKAPKLNLSNVRPWVKSHKKSIQEQKKKRETSVQSTIGGVTGRPLLIEEVLNLKLG